MCGHHLIISSWKSNIVRDIKSTSPVERNCKLLLEISKTRAINTKFEGECVLPFHHRTSGKKKHVNQEWARQRTRLTAREDCRPSKCQAGINNSPLHHVATSSACTNTHALPHAGCRLLAALSLQQPTACLINSSKTSVTSTLAHTRTPIQSVSQSVTQTFRHSASEPSPLEVKIFALMALFYIIAVTLYKFIQLPAATCNLQPEVCPPWHVWPRNSIGDYARHSTRLGDTLEIET